METFIILNFRSLIYPSYLYSHVSDSTPITLSFIFPEFITFSFPIPCIWFFSAAYIGEFVPFRMSYSICLPSVSWISLFLISHRENKKKEGKLEKIFICSYSLPATLPLLWLHFLLLSSTIVYIHNSIQFSVISLPYSTSTINNIVFQNIPWKSMKKNKENEKLFWYREKYIR